MKEYIQKLKDYFLLIFKNKYKIQLTQKKRVSNRKDMLISVYAIIFALCLCGVFLLFNGTNPFIAFSEAIRSTLFSNYGLSEVILKTIPLIFTGLAVAIALNSTLWNIGAEGQLYFGAFLATAVALYMPKNTSSWLCTILVILAGIIGGAIWAFFPAILKVKFKMNEVITTLLLNYVAIYIVDHYVYGIWKNADNFPFTEYFTENFKFHRLGFGRVHTGLIYALIACVIIFVLLKYSSWGYKVRITGSSVGAAKYAGIKVKYIMFTVFLLSGGLAGLAGVSEICGVQYRLHPFISSGYGYTGIIVAWLARSNPFLIVILALFMSLLITAAEMLEISMGLPKALGTVIQGLILFSILGSELFKNYKINFIKIKK